MRALTTGLALAALLLGAPTPARAQQRVDGFARLQGLKARAVMRAGSAPHILVSHPQAFYPDGTTLRVTLHYIQGKTTRAHPFGTPDEARLGTKRHATRNAVVNNHRFSVTFGLEGAYPPGEYVATTHFMLVSQRRKVRKAFVRDYLPDAEAGKPCQFCRLHFGMTKVAVSVPGFLLRDRYARMGGPLWRRQKADWQDRVLTRYRRWLDDVTAIRDDLDLLLKRVYPLGPLAQEQIARKVAAAGEAGPRTMATEMLGRLLVARDRYAATAARGGHPASPVAFWQSRTAAATAGSLGHRLAALSSEMAQMKREQPLLLRPPVYARIRDAAAALSAVLDAYNLRVTPAAYTRLETWSRLRSGTLTGADAEAAWNALTRWALSQGEELGRLGREWRTVDEARERIRIELRVANAGTRGQPLANAALQYWRTFAALRLPTPEQAAQIDQILAGREPYHRSLNHLLTANRWALDQTALASHLPRCSFGLDLTQGAALRLPHLARHREMARLLRLDARRAEAEGRPEIALGRLLSATRLGLHLEQDGVLVSTVLGIREVGRALAEIQALRTRHAAIGPALKAGLDRLPQPLFDPARALRAERFTLHAILRDLADHPDFTGALTTYLPGRASEPVAARRTAVARELGVAEARLDDVEWVEAFLDEARERIDKLLDSFGAVSRRPRPEVARSLTAFEAALSKAHPLVRLLHGGGWRPVLERLAELDATRERLAGQGR